MKAIKLHNNTYPIHANDNVLGGNMFLYEILHSSKL